MGLMQEQISQQVSTHAPLRGATTDSGFRFAVVSSFYSRPSARGDRRCSESHGQPEKVSTHAPLRGATLDKAIVFGLGPVSTHAPLRGATPNVYLWDFWVLFLLTPLCEGRPFLTPLEMEVLTFLLTPLCEGRLVGLRLPDAGWRFYSRPSARGDLLRAG